MLNASARSRAILTGLVILAVFLLSACHRSIQRPDDALTAAPDILAKVDARLERVSDVRLLTKGDYWDTRKGKRVVGQSIVVLARAPASVRIQINSGFGTAVSALASDGESFAMLDQHNKVYYYGPATAENLSSLLPIYLPGDDLVRVLRGGFPTALLDEGWRTRTTLTWNEETGRHRLVMPRADGTQQIVELTHPALAVAEVVLLNTEGEPLYRYQAKNFKTYDGIPLPGKSRFEVVTEEVDVILTMERVDLNPQDPAIPDRAFTIPPPAGVKQVPLP